MVYQWALQHPSESRLLGLATQALDKLGSNLPDHAATGNGQQCGTAHSDHFERGCHCASDGGGHSSVNGSIGGGDTDCANQQETALNVFVHDENSFFDHRKTPGRIRQSCLNL